MAASTRISAHDWTFWWWHCSDTAVYLSYSMKREILQRGVPVGHWY